MKHKSLDRFLLTFSKLIDKDLMDISIKVFQIEEINLYLQNEYLVF